MRSLQSRSVLPKTQDTKDNIAHPCIFCPPQDHPPNWHQAVRLCIPDSVLYKCTNLVLVAGLMNSQQYNNMENDSVQQFQQQVQDKITDLNRSILLSIYLIIIVSVLIHQRYILNVYVQHQTAIMNLQTDSVLDQLVSNLSKNVFFLNRTRALFKNTLSGTNLCGTSLICESNSSAFGLILSAYYPYLNSQFQYIIGNDPSASVFGYNYSTSEMIVFNMGLATLNTTELKSTLIANLDRFSYTYFVYKTNLCSCLNITNNSNINYIQCISTPLASLTSSSNRNFAIVLNTSLYQFQSNFSVTTIRSMLDTQANFLNSNHYLNNQRTFFEQQYQDCFDEIDLLQYEQFGLQCKYQSFASRSTPVMFFYTSSPLARYHDEQYQYVQKTYSQLKIGIILVGPVSFYTQVASISQANDSMIFRITDWILLLMMFSLTGMKISKYIVKHYLIDKLTDFNNNIQVLPELALLKNTYEQYQWISTYSHCSLEEEQTVLQQGLEKFSEEIIARRFILDKLIKLCDNPRQYEKGIEYIEQMVILRLEQLHRDAEIDQKKQINDIYKLEIKKLKYYYKHLKFNPGLVTVPIHQQYVNRIEQYENKFMIEEELELECLLARLKINSVLNIPLDYRKIEQLQNCGIDKIINSATYLLALELFKKQPLYDYECLTQLYFRLLDIQSPDIFKYKTLKLMSRILLNYPQFKHQSDELLKLARFHNTEQKFVSIIFDSFEGLSQTLLWNIIKNIYQQLTAKDSLEIISISSMSAKYILEQTSILQITSQQVVDRIRAYVSKEASRKSRSVAEALIETLKQISLQERPHSKLVIIILSEINQNETRSERESVGKNKAFKQYEYNLEEQYLRLLLIGNNVRRIEPKRYTLLKKLKEAKYFRQLDLKQDSEQQIFADLKTFFL